MWNRFMLIAVFGAFLLFFGCKDDRSDGKMDPDSKVEKPGKPVIVGADQLITKNAVGKFRIGRTVPGRESVAPLTISREKITTTTEEGPYEETVYVLKDKEKILLQIKPEFDYETMQYNQKTAEIIVFSDHFLTEKGIGVNSTLEDFLTAYPDYKLWYTYVSGMFVLETTEPGLQFILDPKHFKGDVSNATSEITTLEPTDFKSGAKIKQVRLFNSDVE